MKPEKRKLHPVLQCALDLTVSLLLVLFMKTYVASAFQVVGGSMCNTLNYINQVCQMGKGEYLIIDKLGYQDLFGIKIEKPQRGDIIIFHPPSHEEDFYIKRIIGLPGESVEFKNGKVYIHNTESPQGFELAEPYLNEENDHHTFLMPSQQKKNFKVPQDHYFVLGDNREHSSDSRSCFDPVYDPEKCDDPDTLFHYVASRNIEGKAWFVLWPLEKVKIFSTL